MHGTRVVFLWPFWLKSVQQTKTMRGGHALFKQGGTWKIGRTRFDQINGTECLPLEEAKMALMFQH